MVVLPRWCGGVLVGRRGGRGGAESAGNPSLAISYSAILWGEQRTHGAQKNRGGGVRLGLGLGVRFRVRVRVNPEPDGVPSG